MWDPLLMWLGVTVVRHSPSILSSYAIVLLLVCHAKPRQKRGTWVAPNKSPNSAFFHGGTESLG